MAWYRSGTVTTANGSPVVTGAGTDFVSNTTVGEVFLGPDGRVYEIAQVVSATQLTILPIYQGASAGGQAYGIQPTQSFVRDLALNAATLLNTFGAVRDGIGQGLIGDGSSAAPGIRFAADQDTGVRRPAENALSLVTGGVDRLSIDASGNVGVGATTFPAKWEIVQAASGAGGWNMAAQFTAPTYPMARWSASTTAKLGSIGFGDGGFQIFVNGTVGQVGNQAVTIDSSGNLLVGTAGSSGYHQFVKAVAPNAGAIVFGAGAAEVSVAVTAVTGGSLGSAANAALRVNRDALTGRSVNAYGTINASGADYAEYVTKAVGCGTIAAGDVCGIDEDGKLTSTWADAMSFVVKSTDPAYVGGDSWAAHLPAMPDAPDAEPVPPIAPGSPPEIEDEAALAAWRGAAAAYPAQMAAYTIARADWQAATDAYAIALPQWNAALEAERVKVDRIAFCGQVPVNVTGDFVVGDYLIAAAAGAGIKAVAVPEADITFDQYRRRLGKVWAVRDGRAWVDVQHG